MVLSLAAEEALVESWRDCQRRGRIEKGINDKSRNGHASGGMTAGKGPRWKDAVLAVT